MTDVIFPGLAFGFSALAIGYGFERMGHDLRLFTRRRCCSRPAGLPDLRVAAARALLTAPISTSGASSIC
jgi:hypothetical protein